ncbi:MAG TPA: hypothetical protein VIZ00_02405 [Streptosporangiaceae bacterium]
MGEQSSRPDQPMPGESGGSDSTWFFADPEPPDPEPVTPEPDTPEPAASPSVTVFPMTGPPIPPPPPAPPQSHAQTQAAFGPPAGAAFHPPTEASFQPPPGAGYHPQTEASFGPPAEAGYHPQTQASFPPEADAPPRPGSDAARAAPGTDFVRYGPGVPMTPEPRAGLTAEDIWRTGLVAGAAPRPKPRWRRAAGSAVTVALLAIAAVILFLRFHHPALAVTSAAITQQTRNGCTVDVTGKIATSGGAGTVSYQWVFRPDTRPPQPLTQTVIAGQKAVFVTVAVEGSGQGSAAQSVTLQVLGPDRKSAATSVVVRC